MQHGTNNQTDVQLKSRKVHIASRIEGYANRRSNRVLLAIRQIWRPNRRFPPDVKRLLSMQPIHAKDKRNRYGRYFPNCQLRDILQGKEKGKNPLYSSQFYVRKIVWKQNRERTVHFVAGPHRKRDNVVQVPIHANEHINNEDELWQWLKNHPWYGFSRCRFGQIDYVSVNNQIMVNGNLLSARRCGFGSLLSYLCFRDRDHLLRRSGYQLLSDQNWGHPQMQQITNLGFNNRECNRIIYVNYAFAEKGTLFGNKAIIYGAAAAGYTQLVTYRHQGECANCCAGGRNGRRANTFMLQDLVDDINRGDPRGPLDRKGGGLLNPSFRRHYGQHWYFCSTTSRRRYRATPTPMAK